jgi:hypothetical protein
MHKVFSEFLLNINWQMKRRKVSKIVHLDSWESSDGFILILHWLCFSGMPVSSLYTKCRERFLVSSQVTLNSHLTEFKDHDLVKIRKHSDGQDCLRIPLVSDALEKLLQELAWHPALEHCSIGPMVPKVIGLIDVACSMPKDLQMQLKQQVDAGFSPCICSDG